jgi:hypothetical protein
MNPNRLISKLMIVASLGAFFPMNLAAQEAANNPAESPTNDSPRTPAEAILPNAEGKVISTDTTAHRQRAIAGQGVHVVETEDGIAAYSDSLGKWDSIIVASRVDGKPRLTQATVGFGGIATVVLNDELLGFSSEYGHWLRHAFPQEFRGTVQPVVGNGVAAVTIGDEIFGMNGKSRHWSRMTVPAEFRGKVGPVVGTKKVHTEIGNKVFVLSSTTGEWTSPGELKTGVADELASTSSPRRDSERLLRSPQRQVASQLTSEIAQGEARAALVAAKVHKLTSEQGKGNASAIEARRELDQELAAVLELRFRREELQVRELQSRLSRLEQMIGQRKAQRAGIIERRANELIEGEVLRWERSDATDDVQKIESSAANER